MKAAGIKVLLKNEKFCLLACFLCGFFIFYSIKLVDSAGIKVTFLVRTILIFIQFVLVFRLFFIVVKKQNMLIDTHRNGLTLLFTIIVIFLALELIFMFFPQSHAFHGTLASRVWRQYYWKPINRLKYRDREIIYDNKRRNILIVGDSLTAGDGIKNVKDRLSDLLGKELAGAGFNIYNLGQDGADTRSEYINLMAYPVRPDIVILQYFGNDINCPAGKSSIASYSDLNIAIRYLVKFSFFFNYVYWKFPHPGYENYFTNLSSCYRNRVVYEQHLSDLAKFIDYCKEREISLIVVIFPFLNDIELSRVYTEPIGSFFDDNKICVLKVADLVKDLPMEKRIVNVNDPHPSRLVNKLIADELHKIIIKKYTGKSKNEA